MKIIKLILILSSISSAQAMMEEGAGAEPESSRKVVKTLAVENDKYDELAHEVASYFPGKVKVSVLTEMVRPDYLIRPRTDQESLQKKIALAKIRTVSRENISETVQQNFLAEKYFLELQHKRTFLKVFFKSWEVTEDERDSSEETIDRLRHLRRLISSAAKKGFDGNGETSSKELESLYTFIMAALKYEIADKDSKSGKSDIRLEKIPLQKYKDEFIAATKSSGALIGAYIEAHQPTASNN